MRTPVSITIVFWMCAAVGPAMACPLSLPSADISIAGHKLSIEVATTAEARRCGLSNRDALAADAGMLFVYPSARPLVFWMKDTYVPLAIAFLDEHGTILDIQRMAPLQTEHRYSSPGPARFALEVNQGWFDRHGIASGQTVNLEGLPDGR